MGALRVVAGLGLLLTSGCPGKASLPPPPGLAAHFDYSMPARFEIPDPRTPEGQYEVYVGGVLHPTEWPVALNACASTGGIVEYRWTIDGTAVGSTPDCNGLVYPFAAEGTYPVSLVVEDRDGETRSHTADVVVRDYLIFGIGDSYGSGEGNPDVPASIGAGNTIVPAQWQNRRCHRSAHAGQVRAAQWLEEVDPHSSVTFIHLACSGARVQRGLLREYLGIEPDGPPFPPQLDRVAELAAGREIDALVISIGGNDVNFSSLIEACILGEDCHQSPVDPDPVLQQTIDLICPRMTPYETECVDYFASLLRTPEALDAETIFAVHSTGEDVNGLDVREDGLDDLPDNYRDLAREIVSALRMDPARVHLTELPDITRNQFGQICGWPMSPNPAELAVAAVLQIPGVTQPELTWASTSMSVRLRATMRDAASEHGWQFVEGISNAFFRHGYCSLDAWLVRLQSTFLIQGDAYGALHPDVAGHGAYAAAIVGSLAH